MKKLMKSVLACALAFAMVLTVMPVNSYAASDKKVVVTSQKQLEKALKSGATNIVIKTDKKIKITIPASKKAEKVSISVQAKNATITNKASVKSIEIKDAKAFVESGKNNDIKITDSKLSLTVTKASKGADIQVAKKNADIKVVAKGDVASVTVAKTANVALTVNKTAKVDSVNVAAKGASVDLNAKGTVSDVKVSEKAADTKLNINASGKVENVQIDAKADVAVAGSTTEAVKVTVNAKDTTIKAETPIDTTLNADTKLDLSKGAEGSTVTTGENVKADVANNTTDKVSVKDSTGKETTVDAGKTETKTDDGKKDDEKKDDQKTDDNPGTVTPAPTPTPTPQYPKVEFTETDEDPKCEVYYSYEKKAWLLTVDFLPGDEVYIGENQTPEDGWWFDVKPIGDDLITYLDDESGTYTRNGVEYTSLVFVIDSSKTAGNYSLQFDYIVSYPDENILGQKRFTVNYAFDSSMVPSVNEVMVISPSAIYVDFSKDVRGSEEAIDFSVEDENHQTLTISKKIKDEDQFQRYELIFSQPLTVGTYTVNASFDGVWGESKKFTYDPGAWDSMEFVRTEAQQLMSNGVTEKTGTYSDRFLSELTSTLDEKYEDALLVGIGISVDAWTNAGEESGKAWIIVYIHKGNAMYRVGPQQVSFSL